MQTSLSAAFTVCVILSYNQGATGSECSLDRFSGAPSTSCFENYQYDNSRCDYPSDGHAQCTRIEISNHTIESMINLAWSSHDERLRSVLTVVNTRMLRLQPTAGVVLTYTDEGTHIKPACSVYLRQGDLQPLGPVVYNFTSESECINVGTGILHNFFETLRIRVGLVAQPYDKLLFLNYPVDKIRSYYETARSDPSHAIFTSLIQKQATKDPTRSFSVKVVPAILHNVSGAKSIPEVAAALDFPDPDSTWHSIWSLNYDEVHNPSNVPDGATVSIPLVASSSQDWRGPFSIYDGAEDLAVEIYKNENAIGMVERVQEVAERFGEEQIFLPIIVQEDFHGEEVVFFE